MMRLTVVHRDAGPEVPVEDRAPLVLGPRDVRFGMELEPEVTRFGDSDPVYARHEKLHMGGLTKEVAVFPFDRVRDAFAGRARGKIVVQP